ncbi:MAG: hypothetical protein J1E01_09990 [Acetatifactor sp.]|nr:hypothetical protein [Acetatifactor sp.]
MAFGAIELTTITRAHDYTTVKHNEDNKGFVDQTNFSQQVQKTTEQHIRQVHGSDDSDWHQQNPDAKEKGRNEYQGDGGRRRKQGAQERVVVKGHTGFDMKI